MQKFCSWSKYKVFTLVKDFLQGGWICWYHIQKSNVDDRSFGSYNKSLIIAKTITIPIIFGAFIFRNDKNYRHALKLNVQY